jgi:hypothetical protein
MVGSGQGKANVLRDHRQDRRHNALGNLGRRARHRCGERRVSEDTPAATGSYALAFPLTSSVASAPPTFRLARDQIARVSSGDREPSNEYYGASARFPALGPATPIARPSLQMSRANCDHTPMRVCRGTQIRGETGGEPLGAFRMTLPPSLSARLRDEIGRSKLDQVPPATQGGPGTSVLRIRIARGSVNQEAAFSSGDIAIIESLQPMLTLFNEISGLVSSHPYRAIIASLRHRGTAAASLTFEIALKNVGTETVAIPGLISMSKATGPDDGERRRQADQPIILTPGAVVTCETRTWASPPGGGRHLAQAVFSSYGSDPGPTGVALIRGRALSEALELP